MDTKELRASEVYNTLSNEQKVALYNQLQLQNDGPYTYRDGVYFEAAAGARLTITFGMIEARMMQGMVAVSDLYIAYAISQMGVCDLTSIQRYLMWLSKRYPNKQIPAQIDISALKSRLKELAAIGIVRIAHMYNPEGKKVATAFSVSDIGAKAVKRRLGMERMNYDAWAFTDSNDRICERIKAAKVISYLLNVDADIHVDTSVSLFDKNMSVKRSILGQIEFTQNDRSEIMYVEPITFAYDKAIKTEEEHIQDIRERLQMFATMAADFIGGMSPLSEQYSDIGIIFVVDNIENMNRLLSQILDISMVLAEKCLITTERLLYGNGGKLYRAFYSTYNISSDDGIRQPKILIDNKHQNLFGTDTYNELALSYSDICSLGLAGICDDEYEKFEKAVAK